MQHVGRKMNVVIRAQSVVMASVDVFLRSLTGTVSVVSNQHTVVVSACITDI